MLPHQCRGARTTLRPLRLINTCAELNMRAQLISRRNSDLLSHARQTSD